MQLLKDVVITVHHATLLLLFSSFYFHLLLSDVLDFLVPYYVRSITNQISSLNHIPLRRVSGESYQECLHRAHVLTSNHFHGFVLNVEAEYMGDIATWETSNCDRLFTPIAVSKPPPRSVKIRWEEVRERVGYVLGQLGTAFQVLLSSLHGPPKIMRKPSRRVYKSRSNGTSMTPAGQPPTRTTPNTASVYVQEKTYRRPVVVPLLGIYITILYHATHFWILAQVVTFGLLLLILLFRGSDAPRSSVSGLNNKTFRGTFEQMDDAMIAIACSLLLTLDLLASLALRKSVMEKLPEYEWVLTIRYGMQFLITFVIASMVDKRVLVSRTIDKVDSGVGKVRGLWTATVGCVRKTLGY